MKERHVFSQDTIHTPSEEIFFPALQFLVKKSDFVNLDEFRHQIVLKEEIVNKQPYSRVKTQSSIYRNIFLNLGFIYLILSGILFWKGTFVSPVALLQNSFKVHPIIPFFCFLAALFCFYAGISMSSVKEAIRKVHRKAKLSVKSTSGIKKLSHAKKKALRLADKIAVSIELNAEQKELLYNELLLELQQEVQQIITMENTEITGV